MIPAGRIGRWLALPVFLYTTVSVFAGLQGVNAVAILGAVAMSLPLLVPLTGRPLWILWFAPPVALAVGGIASVSAGWAASSPGVGLLGGALVASPLPVVAFLAMPQRRSLTGLGVTFAGLVLVVVLEAASVAAAAGGASATVGRFAWAVGQVNGTQLAGFQTLLAGTSGASLPLQSVADPITAGLILLALGGALLAYLDPTSTMGAGSSPTERLRGTDPAGSAPLLFPLGCGVAAAIGFEVVATVAPSSALFVAAVGVLVVISILIAVA